jgi:hypothetical protein
MLARIVHAMLVSKLDLHKVRHGDARRLVIRFIEDHWSKSAELEIVTGNSIKMRGIVMNVLEEYGLPYQISRMFDHNKGYIVTWTG